MSRLNASVAPADPSFDDSDSDFSGEVNDMLPYQDVSLQSNPVIHQQTDGTVYEDLAIEYIVKQDPSGIETTQYRWIIDARTGPSQGYSVRIIEPIVIEDENPDDDNVLSGIARGGEFVLRHIDDEEFSVRVRFNDSTAASEPGTPASPEVVVLYDSDGNGRYDVREELSFINFQGAIFSLFNE